MGMYLELYTLSDENIRRVSADPPLIWKVVAPDDPEAYENARTKKPTGFLARLFGRQSVTTPQREELALRDGEVVDTELGKAWHGIHYLLTQTECEGEEPLNFLVSGGTPIGDVDVGYGPARAFTAAEVSAIREALRPIDDAFLRGRFNPSEMMRLGIYPEIWDRDPAVDDTLGWCLECFSSLKAFIETANERNMGLVIRIC
ncbi:MAG: YfbM family protein [Planctomycetes bacterium]|nr:YfbM family protein [Planctomycetota bacterium]OQC32414.1 MAG: hypothetical protein BWX70_00623 [Verrucomicrobia bacterium ADurb.Bin070]